MMNIMSTFAVNTCVLLLVMESLCTMVSLFGALLAPLAEKSKVGVAKMIRDGLSERRVVLWFVS